MPAARGEDRGGSPLNEQMPALPDTAAGRPVLPWQQAAWPDEPATGAAPGWYRRFAAAWQCPAEPAGPRPGLPGPPGLQLLEPARPLLADGQRRLADALAGADLPGRLARLPGLLTAGPPLGWLGMCMTAAMAAELAEAREAGELTGGTPEQRFGSFAAALTGRPRALAVWRKYPVLARQVTELIDGWVAARVEFAQHLAADLADADTALGEDGDLGELVSVQFGGGETHRGGRGVAIAGFTRGTVVYKPRSLALDGCFDRLLRWFNDGGPAHPLRRVRLLDRGDHGWTEHVTAAPCGAGSLAAYFWRCGALLALTYLTHGFDLHAENVIAAGDDPVIVDLEGLFHTSQSQPVARAARLGDPAAALLDGSVLRTGLLPGPLVMPDVETGAAFGVDISPLGGTPVRRSLIRLPTAAAGGTDQMHVRYRYRSVTAPPGRLRAASGGDVASSRFRDELVAGFRAAYQRLSEAKDLLLAPAGPLAGCEDAPARLIQLSTFLYMRLLLESWHPSFGRQAADRDRCLSRVTAGWPGVPHRAELTAADLAALRRGEVPTFGIRPGLRDVWLEDGRRLPGVLAEPPLHAIRRRLAGLRPADQAEQIAIIDASLAAAGQEQAPAGPAAAGQATPGGAASAGDGLAAAGRPPARSWRRAGPPPRDQLRDRLLGAALRIGEHLGATAVRDGGRIGWLTVETVDAQHRRVAPAGLAGYSGLPGIGLFVSSLAAVTGDRQAAVLADQVADEVARRCLAAAKLGPPARGTGVGAFGPLLAPVYYLAHAAVLHGRAELADLAHAKLVPAVAGLLAAGRPEVSPASVAGGRAGCVLALLALHAVRPDPELVRLAGLAARGPAGPGGQPAAPGSGEAGLGYGASGAALALSRLHAVTGEPELADAAGALLGGEPDPAPAAGWCDGAAGAGMARLELAADPALAHLRDTLTSGLRRSVAVVAANLDRAPDDSLCHGRLGMLELLTSPDLASSGLASADPASADPASTGPAGLDPWLVAAELCERGAAGCRTALPQPAPGLLPGLAGIGFGLIRLACPGVVPHALVLAPPAPRADATDRVPDPLAAAT